MKQKFSYFSLSTVLFSFGMNLINVFGVVYLYTVSGGSIAYAVIPYAAIHGIYALLLPFFVRISGKIGTRTSMMIGSLFFLISSLVFVFNNSVQPAVIISWVLLMAAGHLFFYVSYTYYAVIYTDSSTRGSSLTSLVRKSILVSIFLPLTGGLITQAFGILGLALTSAGFIFISFLPLSRIDNFKFLYSGRLRSLLSLRSVRMFLRVSAANELQGDFDPFWLIYIFLIAGSFLQLGELLTIITILNFIATKILGKFLDRHNRRKFLHIDSIFLSFTWLLRSITTTAGGILLADTLFRFNENLKENTATVLAYDLISSKDQNAQLDEKIVIREMGINLMWTFVLLFGLLIVTHGGFQMAFIAAGLFSLLFLLV